MRSSKPHLVPGMDKKALDTRRLAARTLSAVEENKSYITEALRRAARRSDIFYSFLQRLVKGTLQWQDRLDAELSSVGLHVAHVSSETRALLRMAAYQLTVLPVTERQKVFAETEALTHTLLPQLQKLYRREKSAPACLSVEQIATYYSHPRWVVERWAKRLGLEETARLCEANNRPWPVCVRVNTLRVSPKRLMQSLRDHQIEVREGRYLPAAFVIESVPKNVRLDRLPEFQRGLFQVQDEGAQMIGSLVAPQTGERILDACAAPGGKATHLALMMKNKGKLIALDKNPGRLRMVEENAARQGADVIQTESGDGLTYQSDEPFDRILVDAPCSGLGVLGKKVDVRTIRRESDVADLIRLQRGLLDHLSTLLKVGGILVYSTCTLLEEENQGVVGAFLRDHPEYRLIPAKHIPPECRTPEGYLEVWPHRHGLPGAFAAVLKRVAL